MISLPDGLRFALNTYKHFPSAGKRQRLVSELLTTVSFGLLECGKNYQKCQVSGDHSCVLNELEKTNYKETFSTNVPLRTDKERSL